jgi:hypothetical protein
MHYTHMKAALLTLLVLLAPAAFAQKCSEVQDTNADTRCNFEASAYLGLAIDTFAAGDIKKTLNPDDSGGITERAIGGIDFAYRLAGKPRESAALSSNKAGWFKNHQQLWIYGETVHGVRSASVKCTDRPNFPGCGDLFTNPQQANFADEFVYLVRNATSLEGYMGFRWEFLTLQADSDTPANLYFKTQAGFLSIARGPSSAAALHHIGIGAIATKGDFQGSYLEIGWGRNDLIADKRRGRKIVDAYLSRKIPGADRLSFFAQITVDTDLGYRSDSMQTYIGVNFEFFKK